MSSRESPAAEPTYSVADDIAAGRPARQAGARTEPICRNIYFPDSACCFRSGVVISVPHSRFGLPMFFKERKVLLWIKSLASKNETFLQYNEFLSSEPNLLQECIRFVRERAACCRQSNHFSKCHPLQTVCISSPTAWPLRTVCTISKCISLVAESIRNFFKLCHLL